MNRFFKLRNNLGSIYAMFRLGQRPDQVKYVFMIGDRQDNLAEISRESGYITDPFSDIELEKMWSMRYHPPLYDVRELAAMGETTIGGAYARFMLARGLVPNFYENVSPRHKMHYLRLRLRQTHDIWHVLSGFGTDEFGEVGLQGFYFAQVTNGQSALIFASAILKSILRGRFGDLERFVLFFCEGYRTGRTARSLLAVQWEQHWSEEVEALREKHRILVPPCTRPAELA
jgi:ubiquinone biosynthesis protein COQ4